MMTYTHIYGYNLYGSCCVESVPRAEPLTSSQEVGGSIPLGSTN